MKTQPPEPTRSELEAIRTVAIILVKRDGRRAYIVSCRPVVFAKDVEFEKRLQGHFFGHLRAALTDPENFVFEGVSNHYGAEGAAEWLGLHFAAARETPEPGDSFLLMHDDEIVDSFTKPGGKIVWRVRPDIPAGGTRLDRGLAAHNYRMWRQARDKMREAPSFFHTYIESNPTYAW